MVPVARTREVVRRGTTSSAPTYRCKPSSVVRCGFVRRARGTFRSCGGGAIVGGRRRHITIDKGATRRMGEWIKRRGPESWHLVADSPDRVAACGANEADLDADPVSWTDPDRYPPESERCSACGAIFSGAVREPRRSASQTLTPAPHAPEVVRLPS